MTPVGPASSAVPDALDGLATAKAHFSGDLRGWSSTLFASPWTAEAGAGVATLSVRDAESAAWICVVARQFRLADTPVSRLLAVARAQVGFREGRHDDNPYGRWIGMNHVAWCGAFVSWVFAQSGQPLPPIQTSRGFTGVQTAYWWARQHHRLSRTPQPGDVFLILRSGNRGHTGIVVSVDRDGTVHTIEGNTLSGRVAARTRPLTTINGAFYRPTGPIDPRDRL